MINKTLYGLSATLFALGFACLTHAQVPMTGAGLGKPGAVATTPATIFGANLVAWYSADTGITLNGSTVSQWNDLSGNSYNLLQSTGAIQPTFSATGYNSKPSVDPQGGSGVFMATTAGTVAMGGGSVGSLFVVGQMASGTQNNGRLVGFIGNGQTTDFGSAGSTGWLLRDGTNNKITTYNGGVGFAANESISLSTNYRLGAIYDGTNETIYINNSAGTPVAATITWNSPGGIIFSSQAYTTGVASWSGPIAEIVVVNSAATSGQRNSLDTYFTGKWGS